MQFHPSPLSVSLTTTTCTLAPYTENEWNGRGVWCSVQVHVQAQRTLLQSRHRCVPQIASSSCEAVPCENAAFPPYRLNAPLFKEVKRCGLHLRCMTSAGKWEGSVEAVGMKWYGGKAWRISISQMANNSWIALEFISEAVGVKLCRVACYIFF